MHQFDDLDDHDHLLLHGQGLIDLFDDLHDLSPIVDKLLCFYVECAQIAGTFDLVAFDKLVK